MSLIKAFVQNPVKVTVVVILILMFGEIARRAMPMQLTPDVEVPELSIETVWPGASPEEIESEIIQPQEEQLQSVEGLYKMTSESTDSRGRIRLEFTPDADMREALLMANTRLQQVRQYPENVDKPVITTSNGSDRFIAWFILSQRPVEREVLVAFAEKHPELMDQGLEQILRTKDIGLLMYRMRTMAEKHPEMKVLLPPPLDITTQRRFARNFIEARFENVDGVSDSMVMGGKEEEIQVVVDPEKLAARQLTIANVRQALRAQNKDTSGGDFWEGKRRYVVRTLGQFRTTDEVEGVIIARRDGIPVYVRDVGIVRLDYKKPDGFMRRYEQSVVGINASRKTGANVLDVMAGLRAATAELNEGVLKQRGLILRQVYDETEYIYSSIDLVNENIIEGAALTFICLLVFLRSLRSTVIIFLSIFVSIMGMFLMMNLLGRSLNVLSLAGIAFAVGMLVDNFIVVLENIYRHRQEGDDTISATVRGTQEVWGAVLASTLANLAVFVPVLFVHDQAGQLFRDIALAASSALICSLLVALVVVPTAAGKMLKSLDKQHERDLQLEAAHQRNGKHRFSRDELRRGARQATHGFENFANWLLTPLDWFGRWFVNTVVAINTYLLQGVWRRLAVICLLIGLSIGGSYLMLPDREYLPTGNRNLAIANLIPPPGYNLNQMLEMGAEIERRLEPYWNCEVGSPEAEHLDGPPVADYFFVARGRSIFMGMRAADPARIDEATELLKKNIQGMPGVLAVANKRSLFERGLSGGRSIDVEIIGPDVRRLSAIGGQVMGKIAELIKVDVDGEVKVGQGRPNPSLDLSSPEMHVVPKWQQAADMGISAEDMGYTVDALVDGAYAGDYFIDGDKIDLTIKGGDQFASRTQDLEALSLATPGGQLISLAAVAKVEYGSAPEQINHVRRMRVITISVLPPEEMPLENAMTLIKDKIIAPLEASGQLEGGYQMVLSGTADKLTQTWKVLGWNLALAVVITYLLMAALFESWLYPFVIILSVPLGAVGGFAGLKLMNLVHYQALDVMTMLGFIILVGTVVNNPILIVEQALVHIREEKMATHRAILESVRTRIRPIFMTALIGLFGLLPLVISPGSGSELYRGLGSVLLGGLLVSTIFTLVLVPTLFSLAMDTKDKLSQLLWSAEEPPATPPFSKALVETTVDMPRPHLQPADSLRR
jgi:HAE1 family hydrophobic/amphiphilic exporter-1